MDKIILHQLRTREPVGLVGLLQLLPFSRVPTSGKGKQFHQIFHSSFCWSVVELVLVKMVVVQLKRSSLEGQLVNNC